MPEHVLVSYKSHAGGLPCLGTLHHLLHLGSQAGAFTDSPMDAGTKTWKSSSMRFVRYEDMLRQHHPTIFPDLEEVKAALTEEDLQRTIDLRPYANLGCFTVPE